MAEGFWRRIYWRNHARGDQALLGVMVADDVGNITFRLLPDLSRVVAFSGESEEDLREYVDNLCEAMRAGNVLFRYREMAHPMASVQIGEALYTLTADIRTVDCAADEIIERFASSYDASSSDRARRGRGKSHELGSVRLPRSI